MYAPMQQTASAGSDIHQPPNTEPGGAEPGGAAAIFCGENLLKALH